MLYVLAAIFRCCWLTIAVYSFVGGDVNLRISRLAWVDRRHVTLSPNGYFRYHL